MNALGDRVLEWRQGVELRRLPKLVRMGHVCDRPTDARQTAVSGDTRTLKRHTTTQSQGHPPTRRRGEERQEQGGVEVPQQRAGGQDPKAQEGPREANTSESA